MMKLKTALLTTSLATAMVAGAQPTVMNTDASGYFERGKRMYESRNYVGAIDQLSHLSNLPATPQLLEQADYYIAMSKMERDEEDALPALIDFTEKYPTSLLLSDVQLRIANCYFYHGVYGDALVAYTQVRDHALDDDLNEDWLYRMAYCDLQLGNYEDARSLYSRLKGTSRYDDATMFYHAYIDYVTKDYDAAYIKFTNVSRIGELGYQAQYYICQMDYLRKDYNKTISLGESLLSDDVNDYFTPEINRLVGESYYKKGNYGKARTHLNKYLETTQDAPVRSAAYALGEMDYKQGKYQSAVQNMSLVTGEDDAMAQSAYFYLAQSKLKLGDQKTAAVAFEKAAKMDYDAQVKEVASYNYAVTQAKGAGTPFGSSIVLFEDFLNKYPKSKYAPSVEGYLVDAYMNSGDYKNALVSISHIENPSSKVLRAKQNVLYNLGVQAMQKGDNQAAANYLQSAIKVGNYDKKVLNESRLWLAETQYGKGDYTSTENNLKTYIGSASKTDDNYGKAHYDLGYARYKQKKYVEARESFLKAINSGKLDKILVSDAYDRIGDTYYYAGNFADAEASYSKAIAESSGSADGSMFDKAMMAGYSKNYQSKVEQLEELLKKYPQSTKAPAAMLEKGRALEAMGKPKLAIVTYDALYRAHPKVSEARQGLLQKALAEKSLNNIDEAIQAYQTVIKNAPTSDEAKIAAEDLKVMYADRGELARYQDFLEQVPNAPQLDVSELDRLHYEAAMKAATTTNPDIAKMEDYLTQYPEGAYRAGAKYYIGRYNYEKGNLDVALTSLNEALAEGQDASFAEDALSMKSDILARQGKKAEAIETYKSIIEKSTSDDNKIVAQMGVMRTAYSMGDWNEVVTTADVLLQNANLTAEETAQVQLKRAVANAKLGNRRSAEQALKALSKDMHSEAGSQATYELALLQFDAGNLKNAEKSVNTLLDSGSPHAYWIAKGYILLSDIYVKQGKTVEAKEYLESLKNNYPGKEKEIFNEIDQRLFQLTGKKAATGKKTGNKNNNNSSADNSKKKSKK